MEKIVFSWKRFLEWVVGLVFEGKLKTFNPVASLPVFNYSIAKVKVAKGQKEGCGRRGGGGK